MPDELTNSEIALLCDIGEYDLSKATDEQKRDLQRLIFEGYVEKAEGARASRLKLSAKGAAFLGERGAGLNEA